MNTLKNTTNLDELKDGKPFTWGELIKIHQIFSYSIIQYHPYKEDNQGQPTNEYNTRKFLYHTYVDNIDCCESYETTDEALAACIAYRHEGANHRASRYFIKSMQ